MLQVSCYEKIGMDLIGFEPALHSINLMSLLINKKKLELLSFFDHSNVAKSRMYEVR